MESNEERLRGAARILLRLANAILSHPAQFPLPGDVYAPWSDIKATCPTENPEICALWAEAWDMWERDNKSFSANEKDIAGMHAWAAKTKRHLSVFDAEDTLPAAAEHVFEGAPDARQGGADVVPSRFRPRYRALTPDEKAMHDAIKEKAAELEALFEQARALRFPAVPAETLPQTDGSTLFASEVFYFDPAATYFDDGMKSLELSVMWTIKGLTA